MYIIRCYHEFVNLYTNFVTEQYLAVFCDGKLQRSRDYLRGFFPNFPTGPVQISHAHRVYPRNNRRRTSTTHCSSSYPHTSQNNLNIQIQVIFF